MAVKTVSGGYNIKQKDCLRWHDTVIFLVVTINLIVNIIRNNTSTMLNDKHIEILYCWETQELTNKLSLLIDLSQLN